MNRQCVICNEIKDINDFYKHIIKPKTKEPYFYYHLECKECTKNRSYKWSLENEERRKEIQTKYEHTEKKRSRVRKRNKKYSEDNYFLNWQRTNKNKIAKYYHNRRAYRKYLPDSITDEEINYLKQMSDNRCVLSGSTDVQLEHFIPLSWGHGGTYLGNMYFLSAKLNRTKKKTETLLNG